MSTIKQRMSLAVNICLILAVLLLPIMMVGNAVAQILTDEIVLVSADQEIILDWYYYIPPDIEIDQPLRIIMLSNSPPYQDYSRNRQHVLERMQAFTYFAKEYGYLIFSPVNYHIYEFDYHINPVQLNRFIFNETVPPTVYRPDLTVNLMADRLTAQLTTAGYTVKDGLFVAGFSSGGHWSHAYPMLHPTRTAALAAGGTSVLRLPVTQYQGRTLNWPVGVADFSELTGQEFDVETYKSIPRYYFIGNNDRNESLLDDQSFCTTEDGQFFKTQFGSGNVEVMTNETALLQELGYNIDYKIYPIVGHSFTPLMQTDILEFFNTVDQSESDPQ